jgi:wyosine [tRNA(Phe)-imidazoG37] synthetase (radical SAM superfamily)
MQFPGAASLFTKTKHSHDMNTAIETAPGMFSGGARNKTGTAFGCPRNFLANRFVYTVISPRARGLSVGINLTPDRHCNFDCVYCEVDRRAAANSLELDLDILAVELETTLALVRSGGLREDPLYALVPPDLLRLRHVAISGDGEPTLCPRFREALETVVHVRATGRLPFFKIVLITNASHLDSEVQSGLRLLTRQDEIWAKLDAGTQAHMQRVNKTDVALEQILANILLLARQRPIIIQSLFPAVNGSGPSDEEVAQYVQRLKELKEAGAQISLVQIYSATRPTPHSECGHLPLRTLSQIAQSVRGATGLPAEVF